jgi:cyclic beta-1,2-glucan synthetase
MPATAYSNEFGDVDRFFDVDDDRLTRTRDRRPRRVHRPQRLAARPAALRRSACPGRSGGGARPLRRDPGGFELAAGHSRARSSSASAWARSEDEASRLVQRFRGAPRPAGAFDAVHAHWQHTSARCRSRPRIRRWTCWSTAG